jgi:ABC-type nickel/cobalt efflux system permease component RcnA
MGRLSVTRLLVAAIAVGAGLLLPATAAAHPLGNFTINHYAGLTVLPDRIDVDIVIDMAEIPAFQQRQEMDADGDGSVSDDEGATWGTGACASLTTDLKLTDDGAAVTLVEGMTSVNFPPGAGGLSTLRLECLYSGALAATIGGPVKITFADSSYTERIGWREIVATGNGTILDANGLPPTSPSQKLTAYPPAMIPTPLDIRSATIEARPDPAGVVASPAPAATDGSAAVGPGVVGGGGSAAGDAAAPGSPVGVGVVPGGVAADLPDIFRTSDLTPIVILASLLTAVVIGAGHALTPGHGKTLMAAYLVGSRGTAVHAVGLGLSVAVSHTLGIFALAFVIVGAGSILPPDVVYRVTPVIAGTSIVVIGGWMLFNELRRRLARRSLAAAEAAGAVAMRGAAGHEHPRADVGHAHEHAGHDHEHVVPAHDGVAHAGGHDHVAHAEARDHGHAAYAEARDDGHADDRGLGGHSHAAAEDHAHPHAADHAHAHPRAAAHAHAGEHAHAHPHAAAQPHDADGEPTAVPGEHSHGGVRHSHLPPAGTTLSWRGLFVLGLAGGLIPSTSALLILLGSIAAGRPAFGLVLVVAFGLGMAAVMTGVGLAMILARTRLDRMPSASSLGRLAAVAPLIASIAVLSLGLVLTWQAVAGTPVL